MMVATSARRVKSQTER